MTTNISDADSPDIQEQIRRGRSRFIAMAVAYAIGNFNDNFMKQAVMLLAVTHGIAKLAGYVGAIFTIPFLVFTAAAGWLADRYSKRHVVIAAKVMELLFLGLAAIGILTLNWGLIVTVIFLMAFQATIFGPALAGSIPDVYPESFVLTANSRLKSATTAATLLGIILAGIALSDHIPVGKITQGQVFVAVSLVIVSTIGLIVSFAIPGRPAANPQAKFPWTGPIDSVRDLWLLRTDGLLMTCIFCDAYFWFVAALQILVINKMGIDQFGLNEATTSYLALSELIGVVAGALIAGKFFAHGRSYRIVPPATAALSVLLCAVGAAPSMPHRFELIYVLLMLTASGVAGGLIMVPVESFFLIRPQPEHRGRVIAASWFACFIAIFVGSLLFIPLQSRLEPSQIFLSAGLLSVFAAAGMVVAFAFYAPVEKAGLITRTVCAVAKTAFRLRYRIKITGISEIAQKGRSGILFLPNHPALIDPVILVAHLHGPFAVHPLVQETQIAKFPVSLIARLFGVVPIPEMSQIQQGKTDRAQQAITRCIEALGRGENVLLYPAGRLKRQKLEDLGGSSAVEQILKALPNLRIVLVRTTGLWGSSFGWAPGTPPRLENGFGHWRSVLSSGIFFVPKRDVTITLAEPADIPRKQDRNILNRYLENFYNLDAPAAQYVPYSPWESVGRREFPEPELAPSSAGPASIPDATRKIVLDHLRQTTSQSNISDDQHLARDLGLDSLAITDMVLWLEKEFGVLVPSVEALHTVGDVLLAACGQLSAEAVDINIPTPSTHWLADASSARVNVPAGSSITEVLLAQASRNPGRVIIADMQRGELTYRGLIRAIFALRDPIKNIPGERVGILLPASVAADIVFFAALFAGKTPVMMNWTVGSRNMIQSLNLVDVKHVITADALVMRLKSQGVDLTEVSDRFVPLEKIARSIGRWSKLIAAIKALFFWGQLRQVKTPTTAVILFTSGSEAVPKAVPLTHQNLLTNIRDVYSSFLIRENDRFLGMLPPFHSFGLTGTMLMPILAGVKVVHYPNPNEVAALAKIIETYHVSILLGTPTFLSNIIRSGGKEFSTLRLCVTGAEKCPQSVYDMLREKCPKAVILEGYGITECSPIVAVNREDDSRPGTIGRPLPLVSWTVINEETGKSVAAGQSGMLLVRGESIFNGYLNYNGPSPFVQWEGQSWYRTGDLVQADANGHLTFVGRLKRFVKIGGEMISLPAIEEVLEKAFPSPADKGPGLAVIQTPDENHPELVLFSTRALDRSQVNQAIRNSGLSPLHNIRATVQIEHLPVLGTGKTDYRALKAMLKSDGDQTNNMDFNHEKHEIH
ncbi:MAG TPA: MFS transporter [Phycisphaerae bacterium]|nr:MFS transporter [Phycisphaerae bacterium]